MPFPPRPLEEVRESIYANADALIPGADARVEYSTYNGLFNVLAALFHSFETTIQERAKQSFIQTATNGDLDNLGEAEGVDREVPTRAAGTLRIGAVYESGGSRQISGNILVYRAANGVTVTVHWSTRAPVVGNYFDVPLVVDQSGPEGNLPAGTTLTLANLPTGHVPHLTGEAVVGDGGFTGGKGAEPDAEYRARILRRTRLGVLSGRLSDYRAWALDVPSVSRAWASVNEADVRVTVYPITDPAITSPAAPTSPEALRTAVTAYVAARKVAGVKLTVAAPTFVALNPSIRLVLHTGADETDVRRRVQNALIAHLREVGGPGDTIYLSRLIATIDDVVGERANSITSHTSDIVVGASSVYYLGSITWVA